MLQRQTYHSPWHLSWTRRQGLLIGLILLQVLDLTTTYIGFSVGLREANPIAVHFLFNAGPASLSLLKLAGVLAMIGLVLAAQNRYPKIWRGVTIACLLSGVTVLFNILNIVLEVV